MMKKANWAEMLLAVVLVVMAALFTCAPRQALASPMSMLRSMVSGITLHTWGSGDVLRAADLNGNFTALNNGKVGGGVQLVNADVSNSAAIAHAKLATPALVPKAWATLNANCTGSTAAGTACTVSDSSQVTSITTNGASGQFRLNLAYTPANANFAVFVTSHTTTSVCMAQTRATAAPHAIITCFDYTGAALDTNQFSVLVMDS